MEQPKHNSGLDLSFLAILVLLCAGPAHASWSYSTGFESDTLGAGIDGQDGWTAVIPSGGYYARVTNAPQAGGTTGNGSQWVEVVAYPAQSVVMERTIAPDENLFTASFRFDPRDNGNPTAWGTSRFQLYDDAGNNYFDAWFRVNEPLYLLTDAAHYWDNTSIDVGMQPFEVTIEIAYASSQQRISITPEATGITETSNWYGLAFGETPTIADAKGGKFVISSQYAGIDDISLTSARTDCGHSSDLLLIASQWLDDGCVAPTWCCGADINQDTYVNIVDFALADEPLKLLDDGVCHVSIVNVFSGTLDSAESYAADLLQDAFFFATGVTPEINPPVPTQVEIRLGLAGRFNAGVADTSDQAYEVRRAGRHVELVGNSPASVIWAATDFCEEVLHVSWPVADDNMILEGTPLSSIVVDELCKVESPDFSRRGWFCGDPQYDEQITNWISHSRQNVQRVHIPTFPHIIGHLRPRGIEVDTTIHSFSYQVPIELCSTHPEYFPLIDGQRLCPTNELHWQPCLSSPGVFDLVVQHALQQFASHPDVKVYGIVQNDGGGWCECDDCAAMDGTQAGTGVYSNRMISFVNSVADHLGPLYPDKTFGTLAYSTTRQPTDYAISDNVAITFCPARNFMKKLTDPSDPTNAPQMQQLNGWLSKTDNISLYEYYYTSWGGGEYYPSPFSRTLCAEFPELYALGVKGVVPETVSKYWPNMKLLNYTFARLCWDTSLSYDGILADYCSKRYGPASSSMKSYHLLYEDTIYSHVSEPLNYLGPYLQFFPPAFTTSILNTIESYLTGADALATAGGVQAHIDAVADEMASFDRIKSTIVDPATIPGIGPNLITNPGAESGSTGWAANTQWGDYSYTVPNDPSLAHSGSRCLRIEANVPGFGRWYQFLFDDPVPPPPGKYAASVWVRASGTGLSGDISIAGGSSGWSRMTFLASDDQWVQLIYPEIDVTGDVAIYLQVFGDGTVCFDDIFFAALP